MQAADMLITWRYVSEAAGLYMQVTPVPELSRVICITAHRIVQEEY